jgi:predicted transcriptional regulator
MVWVAEKVLTAIRDDKVCDCITKERLVMLTGLPLKQINVFCSKLSSHGLLKLSGNGCYELTESGKQALAAGCRFRSGPKGKESSACRVLENTLRVRIWRAMRIRRKFSVPELISLVVDGTESCDITNNVQKYLGALAKAGYITEMPRREPGTAATSNGFKRWWLQDEKDSGPQAPVFKARVKIVYDPNTRATIDISKEVAQ